MTCFGGLLTRRADGVWVWSDGTEELRVYDWDGGPPPKPSDRGVPCYLIPPLTDDGACWFWKADEPAIIAKAVELGWYIDGVAEIEGDPWEGADERLPSMDEIAAEVRRVYGRRGEA